ncbi:MAG TPA: hypothetical protein V6D05_15340, partial [Stenomitos sp.]
MSALLWTVLSVAAVGTWSTSMRAVRRRQLVARRLSLLDDGPTLSGPRFSGLSFGWHEGWASLRRELAASLSRADRRRWILARSVSPLLDRIVCRMTSGMSFDSAVGAVIREHPERDRLLKAELLVYLQETRLGLSPREALLALSRRCGVPALDRVVGAVLTGRDPLSLRAQLLECAMS